MVASSSVLSGPKGRPPLRPCPDDFDVIFIEQGRDSCEPWYRASKKTVSRWLEERGKARLIAARKDYVSHQRSKGEWITRQTRMVTHQEARARPAAAPIRDRRKVSFIVARHAAQHLRVVRNGGFIVSPTGEGDWWIGSRRLSAAQMLDLAQSKGFDDKVIIIRSDDEAALQADLSSGVKS